MNRKKLIGMAAVLVVLASVALIQQRGAQARRPRVSSNETLLQGVDLNAVDALEIDDVRLLKKEGKWVVASLYNYPADFSKLANALRSVADVKLGRPMRAANIDEAEYGFDTAKRILLKSGGKEAARLNVGARREGSASAGWADQYFIQLAGSDAVYLVDYDFRPFDGDAADWIETELLNVRSEDIVSVKVGELELQAQGEAWKLVGLDEESETLKTAEAHSLRAALQYLNCSTVADPAKSDEELGFTEATIYTAKTAGQTYTVMVGGEAESGRYVRLSGDVREELKGWTFVVPAYKADSFMKSRTDLVQAKADESSADEAAE